MKSFDFKEVDFYSSLINDYLSGELKNKGLIDWDYSIEQINKNKSRDYSSRTRKIVHEELIKQYSRFELTEKETENLNLFSLNNSFTITTGHQLMLLGGPMFFYTKIIDVIKLCNEVSTLDSPVLPVFWMASEDHDYEEISKVNLFGKVIDCPGKNEGPVGRIEAKYFDDFLEKVNQIIGEGAQFSKIKKQINKAFLKGENLSEITQIFVRELFKDDGLLIIDADKPELKLLFREVAKDEVFKNKSAKSSEGHLEELSKDYKIQVTPREINLFYIDDNFRKRIIEVENGFATSDGIFNWSREEMVFLLSECSDRISPNVILRPVYQEVLLPNLAYVGGAGEIAYWLELKPVFKAFNIDFPLPLIRTSYFILPEKNKTWLETQGIELIKLFEDIDVLINEFAKSLSGDNINFEKEFEELKKFYEALRFKGDKVSSQLEKVLIGEEKRAFSALKNVEKRFLKAEKIKFEQVLNKLRNIKDKLFPKNKPMERIDSFIPLISNPDIEFKSTLENTPSLFQKSIVIIKS